MELPCDCTDTAVCHWCAWWEKLGNACHEIIEQHRRPDGTVPEVIIVKPGHVENIGPVGLPPGMVKYRP